MTTDARTSRSYHELKVLPIEYIPDEVLAEKAYQLLMQYEIRLGRTVRLPVPIQAIVERLLALTLVALPIEEAPNEVILARIDPCFRGGPAIQLNECRLSHFERYFGTEQYSLAHEVAHWLLHYGRGKAQQMSLPDFGFESGSVLLCRRMSDSDRREYQAERFAAHLLLPEHLVRPAAKRYDLSDGRQLKRFAVDCHVSMRAMERRLDELQI